MNMIKFIPSKKQIEKKKLFLKKYSQHDILLPASCDTGTWMTNRPLIE